jgi:hypothetical protein
MVNLDTSGTYEGSRFSDVRAQLLSDPYTTLPYHKVTIGSMFQAGKNLLLRDSKWLLSQGHDLVPPFQKLLNPVGLCLFGRWRITEETPYTGCLRTGVEHLIIVRCSNQMTTTDRGTRRGFGFAGKIFPTLDPDERVKTVNFVCIDNLGGTFAEHYTDVALTNEPPLGLNFGMIPFAFVAANVVAVFNRVDQPANYRPLYPLAEQGLKPGETAKGPKWIQITTDPSIGKSDAVDFRNELRVKNYKDGVLRFVISGADREEPKGKRLWRRIGVIEVNEDVCSASGDQRLRFHHDPNRGHPVPK